MKIGFVLGTRPEVLKLGLIIQHIENLLPGISTIIDTQQQTILKDIALNDLKLKPHVVIKPNHDINLINSLSHMLCEIDKVFNNYDFQCIIIQGDTLSAVAGAMAAFYKKIPVIHIEAGLRSKHLGHPFPEEAHRRMISSITELHFAPNKQAQNQLISEGIQKDKIFLAGNPLLDIQYLNTETKSKYEIIITIHRRENHCQIQNLLEEILKSALIHPQYKFLIINHTHPNVSKVLENIRNHIPYNVKISDPLSHPDFINLLKSSHLILTDSGGVQEEAAYWNIPSIVLRNVSDRPDGIKSGLINVLGEDFNKLNKLITKQLKFNSNNHTLPIRNNASKLIANHIIRFIKKT